MGYVLTSRHDFPGTSLGCLCIVGDAMYIIKLVRFGKTFRTRTDRQCQCSVGLMQVRHELAIPKETMRCSVAICCLHRVCTALLHACYTDEETNDTAGGVFFSSFCSMPITPGYSEARESRYDVHMQIFLSTITPSPVSADFVFLHVISCFVFPCHFILIYFLLGISFG